MRNSKKSNRIFKIKNMENIKKVLIIEDNIDLQEILKINFESK